MPIKVQYDIFDTRHPTAVYSTQDYTSAKVEYNSLMRKASDLYRIVCTPMADGALTKPEEYLFLVYRVRKLWKQYFNQGRDHDVLLKSIEEEKKLDEWNARTRAFLDSHKDTYNVDNNVDKFGFFIVVEEWRNAWKERKRYSRLKNCDPAVLNEISKKCRDYEREIDKYINDKLKLI